MLERVLEPEVMDSQEESIAYDDMDHQAVNEKFVADLLACDGVEGEILDLGTGPARIPILLCQQNEDVRVLAIDLSPSMLDLARLNIEVASQTSRIMLDLADSKALSFGDERFDIVMSNSIIHHIPDPTLAIHEAVRVCKRGGRMFVRDLLRPNSKEQLNQLSAMYVADESEHARKMFEESLHAALTVEEVREIITPLGFDSESVVATSDRHWTWSAIRP